MYSLSFVISTLLGSLGKRLRKGVAAVNGGKRLLTAFSRSSTTTKKHGIKSTEHSKSDKIAAQRLRNELVDIALSFEGITEERENDGKWINDFQRAVDGVAVKEPWCMAFIQYCLKNVEERFGVQSGIYSTEHCVTCWNKTDESYRTRVTSSRYCPQKGDIVIFNWEGTPRGHAGIVIEGSVFNKPGIMRLIEGNTRRKIIGDRLETKETEGVFIRERSQKTPPGLKFRVVGYLRPWGHV